MTSWVLNTAASLYWRVKGNAKRAIDCLRIALHYAPYNFKDIPLTSLANILHRYPKANPIISINTECCNAFFCL